jgi:hypothetical protein
MPTTAIDAFSLRRLIRLVVYGEAAIRAGALDDAAITAA